MPNPVPRLILSQTSQSSTSDRDMSDQYYNNPGISTGSGSSGSGTASRSVSPSRTSRPRRRSSTIKNALSSILGTNSSASSNHLSTSLPRPRSSLSVGSASAMSAHSSHSNDVRRYSATTVDPIPIRQSARHSNDGAASFHNGFSQEDVNEDDEDAAESCHGTGSVDERMMAGAAESPLALSGASSSLKSFGKEFLSEYLTERGLLEPRVMVENDDFKISIATSGESIFLPTMSCNDDEYLARLNGLRSGEEEAVEIDPDYMVDAPGDTSFSSALSTNEDLVAAADNLRADTEVSSGLACEINQTVSAGSRNPNSGCTEPAISNTSAAVGIDNSMASYTLAVILSLSKPTRFSSIKADLCSRVRVYWHTGVPPTKTFYEEYYCAGSLNWVLNSENLNLFVPSNVSSTEKIIENNRNVRQIKLFKSNSDSERMYLDKNKTRRDMLKTIDSEDSQLFQPGDYVFIIPVAFSNHIPECLYLPSARINYRFRLVTKVMETTDDKVPNKKDRVEKTEKAQQSLKVPDTINQKISSNTLLKKIKNNLHLANPHHLKENGEDIHEIYSEYPINIVRTPPPISISTANKPIYINRVWTNALSYEISFAQKYVSLGSKVPIKIKLAPLTKSIYLKRIRVSVVEKVTFVSKDYAYEYDQIDPVAKDPYNPYFTDFAAKRKKERNISLLEVRTREKGSRAIREEIVENSHDDNLLAYSCMQDDNKRDSVGINEPLTIDTVLDFPKYEEMDKKAAKVVPPYGIDLYTLIPNPEIASNQHATHRGGVIGFLAGRRNSMPSLPKNSKEQVPQPVQPSIDQRFHETTFQNNAGVPVKFHTRLNKAKRGLYLDSLHFSNVYSRHKLEIMLRISKPDERDPKRLRHYEVLIDTPIFLVSDLCNSGNMELPTYHMATSAPLDPQELAMSTAPPTFEEAISIPASPLQSPVSSPFSSPTVRAYHDPDDLSIKQLSLSRSASMSGPSLSDRAALGASSMSLSSSVDSNYKFNNLDRLLSSQAPGEGKSALGRNREFKNIAEENESYSKCPGGPKESLPEPIFKPEYSVSRRENRTVYDNNGHNGSSSLELLSLNGPLNSDPPSYDEVVPLMSDEE